MKRPRYRQNEFADIGVKYAEKLSPILGNRRYGNDLVFILKNLTTI